MPSQYTDEDGQFTSNSGDHGAGSSYTDRFRVDAPYNPRMMHTSGPSSIGRLLALIDRAVRPSLREPDLALNLQISDVINEKKGSAPREAATAIVNHINNRNTHIAILAISVLDVCVKNCGYAFHLQISRKDFLNRLVKRFPDRPPLHYSRVQLLILECIEEWRETLCRTANYRDDLGYIRDMHRLLTHKGYMFPEINREDAAVLNAPETLKSAAELEREDRELQSAKLQELIRSGSPQDLKEANHLMSVMAGFRDTKVDYHAKVAKDLDKVRRKGEILEEMLNNLQPGEAIADDDVFSELVVSLQNAKPKIQKIINDEGESDEDAMAKLLTLSDYINGLIEKYRLVSKGDFEAAGNIHVTSLSSGRKVDTSRQAVIDSLIDIDDAPSSSSGNQEASTADLLGLDFGGLTLGSGGDDSLSRAPEQNDQTSSETPSSSSLVHFDQLSQSPSPPKSSSNLAPADVKPVILVDDEHVKIIFVVTKADNETSIVASVSNPTDKVITNFKLELAAPRSRHLNMSPQSGGTVETKQQNGITQNIVLSGSEPLRLRWRASFKLGLSEVNLDGSVNNI